MFKFSAMAFRMKYIVRWSLMRNSRPETLSEHSSDTAIVAGVLAAIARAEYGVDVSAEKVMSAAVLHDCSEIITGDMPTPVKYSNPAITGEYKKLEKRATEQLLSMLPAGHREIIEPIMLESELSERERQIVKAADILCALIKCNEELRFGNSEFESALSSVEEKAGAIKLPEAEYFIKHYLPAHRLDLDALLK